MNVWLVLPMKSMREGKTRLASALEPRQRHKLLESMLLRTLARAAEFAGLDRTLLVSGCAESRACAARIGARVLEETSGAGLNGALRQAQQELRRINASHMLVVPCDLPRLKVDDLRRLADAATTRCIGIAPDETGEGTNGLCLDTSLEFAFSFGPHSYARHVNHIRRSGLQHLSIETPGLAFDLDLPQHLARIACG